MCTVCFGGIDDLKKHTILSKGCVVNKTKFEIPKMLYAFHFLYIFKLTSNESEANARLQSKASAKLLFVIERYHCRISLGKIINKMNSCTTYFSFWIVEDKFKFF